MSHDEVQKTEDDYRTNYYHQPGDEFNLIEGKMEGITFDAQLMYQIGSELANSDQWPQWKEGSEFKAIRELSQSK